MQTAKAIPQSEQLFAPSAPHTNYAWILHPYIDFFLCCGGIVWLTIALAATGLIPGLNDPQSKLVANITFISLLLFVVPHQVATYFRVYDTKSTRIVLGKKVAILGLFCIGLGCLVTMSPFLASVIGRITFAFSFQHFYAQAYGIALIYCYKRKFFLSKLEKQIFSSIIQLGVLLGFARVFDNPELSIGGYKFLKLTPSLPTWVCPALLGTLYLVTAAFSILMLRKWLTKQQIMPWPAILTVLTAFFIFAYLPGIPNIGGSMMVLYILGHSFFHTPQYLVVTAAFFLKNRGLPPDVPPAKISKMLFRKSAILYFLCLYCSAGGVMLWSALGEGFIIAKTGISAQLLLCGLLCAINLHHYWTDGFIWKLKDKHTLDTLIA